VEDSQLAVFVISFDIDGTLECGDPPGGITIEMVKRAQEMGFIIGSCSDRSATSQKTVWDKNSVEPSFTALKHMLDNVKEQIPADRYLHIGDRDLDQQFAQQAGFEFLWTHEALDEPWLAWLREGEGAAAS
jgi:phosphoglycolate phosphatase-like HAD superfamily hydrolase